jgi:hypothetical protein
MGSTDPYFVACKVVQTEATRTIVMTRVLFRIGPPKKC